RAGRATRPVGERGGHPAPAAQGPDGPGPAARLTAPALAPAAGRGRLGGRGGGAAGERFSPTAVQAGGGPVGGGGKGGVGCGAAVWLSARPGWPFVTRATPATGIANVGLAVVFIAVGVTAARQATSRNDGTEIQPPAEGGRGRAGPSAAPDRGRFCSDRPCGR